MTDNPVQFTMRELRRLVREPLLWAALAGGSLVLGLVGPFGTFESLNLPGRLAYWSAVTVATYFVSVTCVCLLERILFRNVPGVAGYALLGALSGPVVALVVWCMNLIAFDSGPGGAISLAPLVLYAIAIAAVASGLIALFSSRGRPGDGTRFSSEPARSDLLNRLPHHLRGRLLHLSMQDHYVEVNTDRGAALLLMRMADAIAETQGADGLQVHRSHWVARDAVTEAVRRDGRLFLRLENGAVLPVSRSRLETVREAGLA